MLFKLVKSLSKSETRYFKLFSHLHSGDKTYLQLFDAIKKQKTYHEAILIKQFANTSVGNNFTYNKHYLYRQILKSMRAYRSGATIDRQLGELLNDVDFLYEKGLYKHCTKILTKTKKTAMQYERYWILLEILRREFKLMRELAYVNKTEEEMEGDYKEMFDCIDKLKNVNEYIHITDSMVIKIRKKGIPRKKSGLLEHKNWMNHALLKSEKQALSSHALHQYYLCYISYFLVLNDYANAYSYAYKDLKLMDENPSISTGNEEVYASVLYNLILCQYHLKRYNEASVTLNKLKSVSTRPDNTDRKLSLMIYSIEFSIYLSLGKYNEGKLLIETLQKKMDTIFTSEDKNFKLVLYYKFAYVYFGVGDYQKANYWLNIILNLSKEDIRDDINCFARILSLIVYYEQGNDDILVYRERTTHRFLSTRGALYQVEGIILNFIRNILPKIFTQKDLMDAYIELKRGLTKITNDSYEQKALEYFDFISWIESKIDNRPFAEIVREKAGV